MAWATVSQVDDYINAGIDGAAWAALSDSDKEKYIESSYRILVNDPNYSFPSTTTERMQNANAELANYLLNNPDYLQHIQLSAQGVQSFTIGTFSQTFKSDKDISDIKSRYPVIVENLISIYRSRLPAVARVTRKNRYDGKC